MYFNQLFFIILLLLNNFINAKSTYTLTQLSKDQEITVQDTSSSQNQNKSQLLQCRIDEKQTCDGKICYALMINHEEGSIHSLGCLSPSAPSQSQNCLVALESANVTSLCIKTDQSQACCCNSFTEAPCNTDWYPTEHFEPIRIELIFQLIGAVAGVLVSFFLISGLLRVLSHNYGNKVSDEYLPKLAKFEFNGGVAKVVVLFVLFVLIWWPIQQNCMQHRSGTFRPTNQFAFQLFPYPGLVILYGSLPALLFLLDIFRMREMVRAFRPCRLAFSLTSLFLALFCMFPLSLYIIYLHEIYKINQKPKYCKLGRYFWQLATTPVLYVIYIIITFVLEVSVMFYLCRRSKEDDSTSEEHKMMNNTASTTISTAKSNTSINQDDFLIITPRPFVLDSSGEGILTVQNIHLTEWIALRTLVSAPRLFSINPQKLLIPPQRSATISVKIQKSVRINKVSAGLMLQWFVAGRGSPLVDTQRLWSRPYIRPRSEWKFFVLPLYYEANQGATEAEGHDEEFTLLESTAL